MTETTTEPGAPPGPETAEPSRRWSLWGSLFLVPFLLLAGGVVWLHWQIHQPYRGYGKEELLILVPRGRGVAQIARQLEAQGIISSATLFRWYVGFHYQPPSLKAGEYRFHEPLSLAEVARKLHEGRIFYHRVTVPEGLDMEETARIFVQAGFGELDSFQQVLQRGELIHDLDPEAANLEGYLFPETYFLTREMSEGEIVRTMLANFRHHWTEERRQRAQELNLSLRELVTLASLIEKETGLARERPLVSSVFHNRLKRNIPLACDPTVIYAIKQIKLFDGVIRRSDLQLDSPYNTYLYAGLPPGPIANPGLESLDAALHPAPSDYLYFVSRNDGSHVFSTNYREHQLAVQRYQR